MRNRRRGKLVINAVVDKFDFAVGMDVRGNFILAVTTDRPTLLRDHQIIDRCIIVPIGRILERACDARSPENRTRIVRVEHGTVGNREISAVDCGDRWSRKATLRDVGRAAGHEDAVTVPKAEAREVALALEDAATVVKFAVDGCIALAVRKLATNGRINVAARPVALFGYGIFATDEQALEVRTKVEVGNAGESVRTVNGRGAAGDHVDAVEQERRNGVEIGNLRRIIENVSAAIDQHEVTLWAEPAQVERGDAAAGIVREGRAAGDDLRKRVDHLLNVDRTRQRELFRLNHRQRAGRGQVLARDARTGDDNLLVVLTGRTRICLRCRGIRHSRNRSTLVGLGRILLLRPGRARQADGTKQKGRRHQALTIGQLHQCSP